MLNEFENVFQRSMFNKEKIDEWLNEDMRRFYLDIDSTAKRIERNHFSKEQIRAYVQEIVNNPYKTYFFLNHPTPNKKLKEDVVSQINSINMANVVIGIEGLSEKSYELVRNMTTFHYETYGEKFLGNKVSEGYKENEIKNHAEECDERFFREVKNQEVIEGFLEKCEKNAFSSFDERQRENAITAIINNPHMSMEIRNRGYQLGARIENIEIKTPEIEADMYQSCMAFLSQKIDESEMNKEDYYEYISIKESINEIIGKDFFTNPKFRNEIMDKMTEFDDTAVMLMKKVPYNYLLKMCEKFFFEKSDEEKNWFISSMQILDSNRKCFLLENMLEYFDLDKLSSREITKKIKKYPDTYKEIVSSLPKYTSTIGRNPYFKNIINGLLDTDFRLIMAKNCFLPISFLQKIEEYNDITGFYAKLNVTFKRGKVLSSETIDTFFNMDSINPETQKPLSLYQGKSVQQFELLLDILENCSNSKKFSQEEQNNIKKVLIPAKKELEALKKTQKHNDIFQISEKNDMYFPYDWVCVNKRLFEVVPKEVYGKDNFIPDNLNEILKQMPEEVVYAFYESIPKAFAKLPPHKMLISLQNAETVYQIAEKEIAEKEKEIFYKDMKENKNNRYQNEYGEVKFEKK